MCVVVVGLDGMGAAISSASGGSKDYYEISVMFCYNIHMLDFFSGVSFKIVCDNQKNGVTEHPKLNWTK